MAEERNIFDYPDTFSESDIKDYIHRRIWTWTDATDRTITIFVRIGDSEERLYILNQDIPRLQDIIQELYPEARDFYDWSINSSYTIDNWFGIDRISFDFTLCTDCYIYSFLITWLIVIWDGRPEYTS